MSICVSGITGLVGAQIVKDLLEKGYTVHGTARNISDPNRLTHITSLPGAAERFRPFAADLLTEGAFDDALQGCAGAIHCASPYTSNFEDGQKDLIDPAVKGTISFLTSAAKASVPKVVVTSSVAAISDHGLGRPATEEDWNTTSTAKVLPYYASKAQAERAVWDFAKEHPEMKLVVINPIIIIGPSLVKSLNESHGLLQSIAGASKSGTNFPGVFDFTFNFVDNRDVSKAHILALEKDNASGRYICAASEKALHHRDVTKIMEEEGLSPKTANLTNGIVTRLLRFLTGFASTTAEQYTNRHIGNPLLCDNTKIKNDLGMSFMDPEQSIRDSIADMKKWGHF